MNMLVLWSLLISVCVHTWAEELINYGPAFNYYSGDRDEKGRNIDIGSCKDAGAYGGASTARRMNGEVWVTESGNWKLKCVDGDVQIESCIASERGHFEEIPLNTTKYIGGFWFKCEHFPAVKQLIYTQEASCLIAKQEFHINQTWRHGPFKLQCTNFGQDVVGCYFYDSTGQFREMAVGDQIEDGIVSHKCSRDGRVKQRIRYNFEANGCKETNGNMRKMFDMWKQNSLKYQCISDGSIDAIACYLDDGSPLAIGQKILLSGIMHECQRTGQTVFYRAYPCADQNCQAPALDDSNTKQISLDRATRTIGVHSASQYQGAVILPYASNGADKEMNQNDKTLYI